MCAKKYLNKLYRYNITTLKQIQNQKCNQKPSHKGFEQNYKKVPQTIKDALKQTNEHRIHNQTTSPNIHAHQPQPPTRNGTPIHKIINEQTRKRKDKRGAITLQSPKFLLQVDIQSNTPQ